MIPFKCILGLALIFVGALIAHSKDPKSVARGKSISELHCSRCHVVGDFNKYGGIGSTPSFQLLVKVFPDYKERFQTFYARRPHPAFIKIKGLPRLMEHLPPNARPVDITLEDVEAVMLFVEGFAKARK